MSLLHHQVLPLNKPRPSQTKALKKLGCQLSLKEILQGLLRACWEVEVSGGSGSSGSSSESPDGDTSGTATNVGNRSFQQRGYLVVNRQAGMITVKDYPEVLLKVAEFLEKIEGSVQRQVFIQAKIIEVTLNDDYKLGIDWKKVSPFSIGKTAGSLFANTTITGAAATNFTYGPSATAFSAILDALSEQGQVSVL